jgi:hypothetical protein
MIGIMRLALILRLKCVPSAWLPNLYVSCDGHVLSCPCRYSVSENVDGKDDLYWGDIREVTLTELLKCN